MIVFDLECENGHSFEGWFANREDMEKQEEQGILLCPVCETPRVSRKLHAVSIRKSSYNTGPASEQAVQAKQEAIADFVEKVTEYVEKNFDDVGTDFASHAMKMHYGAEDHKNIRGVTTAEEDKLLKKEGIPVLRMPMFRKPDNELN